MTRAKLGARVAVAAIIAATMTAIASPALVASANSADETWLVAAHQSNLAEIAAGKDAQQNATSSDIKDLGKMLVADHTTLDKGVQKLATKYKVDLPSTPTPAQKAALAQVKTNSGDAYDAAWTKSQTTGHLKTKAATKRELSAGSEADVLAAAKTATPVVQKHIDELRSIASDLGISVPTSVSAGTGGQAAATGPGLSAILLIVLGVGFASAAMVLVVRRRQHAFS